MSIARCESRLRQSRGALALAWFGLAGCGAELDPEGVDIRSQSLTFPTNQWATWTEPAGQQFETWVDSPALCTTPDQGIVFVGVRQATAFSRRYRLGLNKWRLSSDPEWASLGTRSFNSKPACTSLDPDISSNSAPSQTHQFMVLGRGTDNRFYAQTMQVDTSLGDWPNDPPEQPAENVKVAWHSISDDTVWLAEQARRVLALDFSEGMLRKARERVRGHHVEFVRADLRQPWPAAAASFDVVVADLVLEHVEHLEPFFEAAARALRAGGRLFVSELHPFRQQLGAQARFLAPETGDQHLVPAYRHAVSEYLNAGIRAGLKLLQADEWREAEAPAEAPPRLLSLLWERG